MDIFQIARSDAGYLSALCKTRRMLSPVVEKVRGRYRVRFSFKEKQELVSGEDRPGYTILAVDLGINAAASWCILTADGTVHAKGVIHLACEEDRLRRLVNRKRMYQRAGKKSRCICRWIREVYNYSLCTFPNGKVYNCDLSAAQNIGARFFLREYAKVGVEGLPATPQRTLCTLRLLNTNGLPAPAAA